jgi:hypothetical protein
MVPLDLWGFISQADPSSGGVNTLVALAAVVGAISGLSAGVVAWKQWRSSATQGYVDQNLAAQQARIDGQERELVLLREREVEHRRIEREQRQRIGDLETALAAVQRECDECMDRVRTLESKA